MTAGLSVHVISAPGPVDCHPGSTVELRWTLLNPGPLPWPHGLCFHRVARPTRGGATAAADVECPAVPVGCTLEVGVEIVAPSVPGLARYEYALMEGNTQIRGATFVAALRAELPSADIHPGSPDRLPRAKQPTHPLMGLRTGDHTSLLKSMKVDSFSPGKAAPVLREVDEWAVIHGAEEVPEVATLFRAGGEASEVRFSVNGRPQVVKEGDVPIGSSLAEYLRYHMGLTGTKICCGEAGCGACTVVLKSGGDRPRVANSCVRPLWSMDGFEVLTTEGLGSTTTGLHKVQETLAKCDGSQCGMCTPGMVMSIFGYLSKGMPKPNSTDRESCIQGNLCRCTGYRPIYKAIEQLCQDGPDRRDAAGAEDVAAASPRAFLAADGNSMWLNCVELADIFVALKIYGSRPHRLVVGNTSAGVVKYYPSHPNDNPVVYINIAGVAALRRISTDDVSVSFGAAVTISEVIDYLVDSKVLGFEKVAEHLRLVASPQVRDMASWTGNLMIAKTHKDFPSDLALLFTLLGAQIKLSDGVNDSLLDIESFLAGSDLEKSQIITEIRVPYPGQGDVIETFKVMRRKGFTHAEVNAGFRFSFHDSKSNDITGLRAVYGNIDHGPLICTKTAGAVVGKDLSEATLTAALKALSEELVVKPPTVSDPPFCVVDPGYRKSLAMSLLYKAWLRVMVSRLGENSVDGKLLSAAKGFFRPASTGTQVYTPDPADAPIGQPVTKVEAPQQAAGEVKYTGDLPWPARSCVGHMVLAQQVGKIAHIDAGVALKMDGVVGFVAADSVESIGANNAVATTAYEIFASGATHHVGQFIGMVCATTPAAAKAAAAAVIVLYEKTEDAPAVAFSASQARALGHTLEDENPIIFESDANSVGGDHSVSGEMTTTGQKHFYMENQVTFAIPDASGGLVVHTSTQQLGGGAGAAAQSMLSSTLKIPANKIVIQTGSLGGAYGGKAFMYAPVAAAACVAALALKRPVLLELDRNTDFSALGGRNPCDAKWTVGYDDSYKITSVHQDVTSDCGYHQAGIFFPATSAGAYDISWWSGKFSSNKVMTATPLNTIMRAPGEFQGCLFMEASIEQVARELKVDPCKVQEANLTAGVRDVWAEMKRVSKYDTKRAAANEFNAANRWRKQGVYMMACDYHLEKTVFYTGWDEKCLVRVEADGSVTLDHTGIEMGQGINTKAYQAVAKAFAAVADDFDMSMIQTVPKSTSHFSFAWVTPTFSSGTSEAVVSAVTRACETLSSRLLKYKGPWKKAVQDAVAAGAELSATGEHGHLEGNLGYHIYAAACVHAEIDVLTGETEILSADIVQDAGKSLNPAVDVGQIEGCFVQALGFCLTEQIVRSKEDGRLVNNGTWDYKIPSGGDIPIQMNVTLLKSTNTAWDNVFGSKATGEPTYCLGGVTFFAVKDAIYAARQDAGVAGYFRLDCPASPEAIQTACLVQL